MIAGIIGCLIIVAAPIYALWLASYIYRNL